MYSKQNTTATMHPENWGDSSRDPGGRLSGSRDQVTVGDSTRDFSPLLQIVYVNDNLFYYTKQNDFVSYVLQ